MSERNDIDCDGSSQYAGDGNASAHGVDHDVDHAGEVTLPLTHMRKTVIETRLFLVTRSEQEYLLDPGANLCDY